MIGRRKKTARSYLRQRLTLQQEVQTADGTGGYVRSWEDVADVWAEINPVRVHERLLAGKLQLEITHKIMLRYRSGVLPGMRILYDNRALNISAVMNVQERGEFLELLAIEGATI